MKTKPNLNLIAALCLAASAHAEVVVYKGTIRTVADLSTQAVAPPVLNTLLVVDYNSGKLASIILFNQGGKKTFQKSVPGATHVTSAPLAAGRTATLLSHGEASENSPTDYSESIIFLRGTNTSLVVSTKPGTLQRNLPRVLGGQSVVTAPGSFRTIKYSFALDATRTITVNNGQLSIDQALDAIAADLTAKGFTGI